MPALPTRPASRRSGGSDEQRSATPSTAATSRPGCARARRRTAPSSVPEPRSPLRSAPLPVWTGCCWISSTVAEARSRRGVWSPPPRRTASRPSCAPSRPSASVPAGCSTWARPVSCSRASTDPRMRPPRSVTCGTRRSVTAASRRTTACATTGSTPQRSTGPTTRSSVSCRSRPPGPWRRSRRSPHSTGSTCCSSDPGTCPWPSAYPETSPRRSTSRRWNGCSPQPGRAARPPACWSPTGLRPRGMTAAGWQFLAIGSDTTILANAVVAELARAGQPA